jgi:hypothetical protein
MLDKIKWYGAAAYRLTVGLIVLAIALNWVALFLRPEFYQPGMEWAIMWLMALLVLAVSFSPLQRKI